MRRGKELGTCQETLAFFDEDARQRGETCDCYPYSASSSTLDMKQVTDEFDIVIFGRNPRRNRREKRQTDCRCVADEPAWWQRRTLIPAGAIYY